MVLEACDLKKTYFRDLPLYKQILLPFSRRQRVKALDSVSICIESGQILGVVGPNGAGKTTLLRILAVIIGLPAILIFKGLWQLWRIIAICKTGRLEGSQ